MKSGFFSMHLNKAYKSKIKKEVTSSILVSTKYTHLLNQNSLIATEALKELISFTPTSLSLQAFLTSYSQTSQPVAYSKPVLWWPSLVANAP